MTEVLRFTKKTKTVTKTVTVFIMIFKLIFNQISISFSKAL